MSFLSFPHIGHYRHLTSAAEKNPIFFPNETLLYRGTVKIHGTNAAIMQAHAGGAILCQSRNRVLEEGSDNCGFVTFINQRDKVCKALFSRCRLVYGPGTYHIFGEFAGQGVQKDMAISTLPKFYVLFAVCLNGQFLDIAKLGTDFGCHSSNIFNTLDFGEWTLRVSCSSLQCSEVVIKQITDEVCRECPVGRFFGVSGRGEGVVWKSLEDVNETKFWFKSKGDDIDPSLIQLPLGTSLQDCAKMFAETVITKKRIVQGRQMIKDQGKFGNAEIVAWVVDDALREEGEHIEVQERKIYTKVLRSETYKLLYDSAATFP